MSTTIYMVMTDRQTWGKGEHPIIALFHSMQGRDDIKKVQLYSIEFRNDITWMEALKQIQVDDLGSVSYPRGAKVKGFGLMDVKGLPAKFMSINNRLSMFMSKADVTEITGQ